MPSHWPSRSPAEGSSVLIAAQSGRALAAAARRAGFRPFVADLFGDSDTRELAAGFRRAPGRFGLRFDGAALLRILDDLAAEAGRPFGVVLGSGFESCPDLIAAVAERFRLLGCSAETVRIVKDPGRFTALLKRLGIPHPEIRLQPPPDPDGWLVKTAGASGGGHVRPASTGPIRTGEYAQRRVVGTPHGFAFLADGRDAILLGDTRQWTVHSRRSPFRYGGAVEPGEASDWVRSEVASAVRSIVEATGLCGLLSADALVDGDRWRLLEINPRPGATLDILDRRSAPLLLAHVEACLGRLSALTPPSDAAASEVVYAERSVPCVPGIDWPAYVRDRPSPSTRVAAGAPLCTVAADATTADDAITLLAARSRAVRAAFRTGILDHASARPSPERQRPRRAAG